MIIQEANKLLAREKFGINTNVNLTLANVLIIKEKLKCNVTSVKHK